MSVHVVSVINMKGGVGKTTITLNLAYYLARYSKKKVLVIDFDPQANTSEGFLTFDKYRQHRATKKVISDIFSDLDRIISPVDLAKGSKITLDDMICPARRFPIQGGGMIDLVPSELELCGVLERSGLNNIEERLKIILRDKKKTYDYVLIDCSPTYSVLTNNALKASDYILIPVKPDPFSTRGIPLLMKKIDVHNQANTSVDAVKVLGLVFSMVKNELRYVASVKSEVLRAHKNVFKNEILFTEYYSRAILENKSIFEVGAQNSFKENFMKFGQEFEQRIQDQEVENNAKKKQ